MTPWRFPNRLVVLHCCRLDARLPVVRDRPPQPVDRDKQTPLAHRGRDRGDSLFAISPFHCKHTHTGSALTQTMPRGAFVVEVFGSGSPVFWPSPLVDGFGPKVTSRERRGASRDRNGKDPAAYFASEPCLTGLAFIQGPSIRRRAL